VYKAGEDIKKGQKLLSKGHVIRAQDVALLANVQTISIPVYKKPIIAIIPTGTELTDDFDEYGKNAFKKINTNGPFIAFIAKEMGAIPNNFQITEDNLDLLKERLKVAVEDSDIVITIGGSSMGKYDLVAESINCIGKPGIIAHGIRLDRGRVTGLGVVDTKPIIMLPGPIQGALNAFIAFVRPLIRSFLGLPQKSNMSFYATITEDWIARNKFIDFKKIVYVRVTRGVDSLVATPYIGETQSISLLNKSNGYIEVSEETNKIKCGQKVLVNLLPGFSFMNDCMF
jgi:molybdenum cofactor synthesis domain-containing protein